jgi:hypothetical protein
MNDRKSVDRWLTQLQTSLEAGDLPAISEKLSANVTPFVLTRFRERKLILRSPINTRNEIVALLSKAAACLSPQEQENFSRYLRFSQAVDASRLRSLEELYIKLKQIPPCSLVDILTSAQSGFDWYLAILMSNTGMGLEGETVAAQERNVHNLNGAVNDLASAVARAVNEWSRLIGIESSKRLSGAQHRRAKSIMYEAIKLASDVNSFEWLFDCVTFGDLIVEDCVVTPLFTYKLQFMDPRRQLIRTLAIRRGLVMNISQRRRRRYLREMLQGTEQKALRQAVEYYRYMAGVPHLSNVDVGLSDAASKALLMLVDAEDDLLLGASQFSLHTQAYYFSAMSMLWFSLGAQVVRDAAGATAAPDLIAPAIPLDVIGGSIDDGADGAWVRPAFKSLTSPLPARNHQALISKPFVQDGDDAARPFLGGHTGLWNLAVREALIQGGALGKSVGAVWEDFYATLFESSEWKIVGRGVKLKKNGRLVTDVDLLLLRGDLLLVVQIKALIGSGMTIYDHWKNRQTIEFGCVQGAMAANFFDSDPNSLVSICGKRSAHGIKHVQPVVLTNCDHLNGWSFEGVPVIGEVTRKAICTGSRVEYFVSVQPPRLDCRFKAV